MFGFIFKKIFGSKNDRYLRRLRPIVARINALEPQMQELADEDFAQRMAEYRQQVQAGERTLDDLLPEVFALVREASRRVMGMRHYDVQLVGGIVLHRGKIAEMKTGEGKTLVATLPVALNALSGKGVHVVTVNDYLATRDAQWMGKLYNFLGLSVGVIVNGLDDQARKEAYGADITYGTNNEFGFDYLRDNMKFYATQLVQRGHNFAIVDEVDSILIDEARTPLIISGASDESVGMYRAMDQIVRQLGPEDYTVDEKARTAMLSEEGVAHCEALLHVDNLFDPANITQQHCILQALKAHHVFKRDVDYIVQNDKVVIVDEFTGRLMDGRRYSDGLHQALEAKENVTIAAENQTLASITFQNYFRMYKKLGGMTGTASTEADEFSEIYGLQIVSIPTNKPRARMDLPDSVYKTVNGKYNAVIEQVAECHAKGQPVLVGTVSVEKSEALSKLLKKKGIEHNVLNAKQHEREAEIVAQAGKQGAVTIATNMAGRGTDIMLGGNVTYMAKAALKKELSKDLTANLAELKDAYEHEKARAKASGTELPTPPEAGIDAKLEMLMTECDGHAETEDAEILHARQRFEELCEEFAPEVKREAEVVRNAGGLFIIGTERHESRRIDNQLRGRAGRQGDPGASRFFLSLEDDLMRIFGGDRVQSLMDSLGLDEDVPIENKLITNTIESAQKKLEASNFAIRKQVLQYDDVMNQQREIIYKQRQMVLDGEDISGKLHEMMRQAIDDACTNYLNGETADDWDFAGLRRHFMNWLCLPTDFNYTTEQLGDLTKEGIADELYKRGMDILTAKEKRYGAKTMRELERICLLRNVDSKWMEHIDNMDQLKQGMGLRGYGQHDPVVEYRIEGFAMFDEMIASIREDAVHMLLTIEIRQQNAEPKREQIAKPTGDNAPGDTGAKAPAPVRVTKIGRNDPCPCGSGLKWKKCTCKEYHPDL